MLERCGAKVPDLLLPRDGLAYDRWAVIACDQFTQDRAYWDAVAAFVGDAPSALRITLPEIDLADAGARVPGILHSMDAYAESVLTRSFTGCALVQRTRAGAARSGLVLAVDLERYDYSQGSSSLIRATEGTIEDRLPPRMHIRRGARLECPHILLLIDDPERTVIEPLLDKVGSLPPLYNFELMMGGGNLSGWAVTQHGDLAAIGRALAALADEGRQRLRYGDAYQGAPLLFAVGDGNHSLATAKACWQEIKRGLSAREAQDHPARYALVELCNLHDEGLVFEPIHRVLLGVDPQQALGDFAAYLQQNKGAGGEQHFPALSGGAKTTLFTADAPHKLPVGSLQGWIDGYIARNPRAEVDYIHGDDEACALAERPDALSFLLPATDKNELFGAVMREGALPRKTFSMGDARDKRYYMECRAIRG